MPVKLLNSLGARASAEMLARYIQHYVMLMNAKSGAQRKTAYQTLLPYYQQMTLILCEGILQKSGR